MLLRPSDHRRQWPPVWIRMPRSPSHLHYFPGSSDEEGPEREALGQGEAEERRLPTPLESLHARATDQAVVPVTEAMRELAVRMVHKMSRAKPERHKCCACLGDELKRQLLPEGSE
jgi:hypothetical protein